MVASLYAFLIVGIVVFLVVWEPTRPIVQLIVAQVIGILVTVLLKLLILMCLRKLLFKGMFRVHPASSNVMMLVLEVWSMGLTIGTMLARLIKLIAVCVFYVGRIDTPVFAKGVGEVGPVPIDNYPVQFRKDLLLHEAHRHPYMERLGVMYMLKLRHGSFGNRAGSAWRLIIVQALMPWLRQFRLKEGDDEDSDEEENGADESKEIAGLTLKKVIDKDSDEGASGDEKDKEVAGFTDGKIIDQLRTKLAAMEERVAALASENAALRCTVDA